MTDMVNAPPHYADRVPGVECIDVTQHFDFLRGNAIKYLWRAGAKGDAVQDLRKAIWYIEREIANLVPGTKDLQARLDIANGYQLPAEDAGCMTQRRAAAHDPMAAAGGR